MIFPPYVHYMCGWMWGCVDGYLDGYGVGVNMGFTARAMDSAKFYIFSVGKMLFRIF
jgi:hypothetical protein